MVLSMPLHTTGPLLQLEKIRSIKKNTVKTTVLKIFLPLFCYPHFMEYSNAFTMAAATLLPPLRPLAMM